jgi:hypothetical protein
LLKEGAILQTDFNYFMGMGQYHRGKLAEAKSYIASVLELQPANMQAQRLFREIDSRLQSGLRFNVLVWRLHRADGLKGIALVGGAALVAGILVAAIVRK